MSVSLLEFSGGALQNLELWIYDQMLNIRLDTRYQPSVTLITISDADLALQQGSSVSDGALAAVLDAILLLRPAVIGVDLYRDIPLPPGTQQLADLLNAHQQIILAQTYPREAGVAIHPPAYLKNPDQAGCTDFPIDSDNSVRRALLYLGDESICYGFGFLLAKEFLSHYDIVPLADPENAEELYLGQVKLPRLRSYAGGYQGMDDAGYQILLDYRYPAKVFHSFSFSSVLAGQLPAEAVTGKIILIGSISEAQNDFFPTPALFQESNSQTIAGLKLHALLVDQLIGTALLNKPHLQTVPIWLEWIWYALMCFAGVGFTARKHALPIFLSIVVLGIASIASITLGLFLLGLWLPLLPAVLGWIFASGFSIAWLAEQENRQKRLIQRLFSCFVGSPIVNEILQHRHEIISQGQLIPRKITGTVFFSDLAGFTTTAEQMESERLIAWLNEYISVITAVIEQHNGVVIRYIGDAVLACFGVPMGRETPAEIAADAQNAARCSLSIQAELIKLNLKWQAHGLPTATMRIGLNTGSFHAGGIGNSKRQEYTIHGDSVNTAARLESYKEVDLICDVFKNPCRILISQHTADYLKDDFHYQLLGNILFKGKNKGIDVYQLINGVSK